MLLSELNNFEDNRKKHSLNLLLTAVDLQYGFSDIYLTLSRPESLFVILNVSSLESLLILLPQ